MAPRDSYSGEIDRESWDAFLDAYAKLCAYTAPVTARTLRDTEPGKLNSSTKNVTRWLWSLSAAFIALACVVEFLDLVVGPPLMGESEWFTWDSWRQIASVIEPFVYGGLGACAYLLRRAHALIAARAFDNAYVPEYKNRVLLGIVSGGGAVLLAGQFVDAEGASIRIGQAALGFVAGYSTDFLFSAVERIVAALLPKVGLDSIRKEPVRSERTLAKIDPDTLQSLITEIEKAEDPELKKILLEMLRKLGG
jgi:hypothetical protein